MFGRSLTLLLAALLIAAVAACYARPVSVASRGAAPSRGSNVEARDYIGSAACTPCHADIAAAFAANPMHRMTRMVGLVGGGDASPLAPFAGESVTVADDRATLETRGGVRFVRLDTGDRAPMLYRVTRVLGGHHREDFVGVPVKSYEERPRSATSDSEGDELVLPVSYLIDKKRVRYKGYSVMVRERSHVAAGPVWNRTCPYCHNTVPLLSTLLGALAGPRAPHFQGEVVDALLPDDRMFHYRATDEGALEAAVSREAARLGGEAFSGGSRTGRDVLRGAIDTTRNRFTGQKLLEVGIGCEACHGGCREHASDPAVHPSLLPRAPYLQVTTTTGPGLSPPSAAEAEDHACARCHQVLFSRYPFTWEGGRRSAMPGGSHINSGEGRDMLLGGCRGALRCTACHDPHATDESAHLAALETPKGNEVCLGCHAALRPPEALRAHAHHDPTGAAGVCIACHMAKKNMSLTGGVTRYHRIGSPTDPARVLNDRPLECAICHADKSVEELLGTMERWWTKVYSRDVLRASYGDLTAGAMVATLKRGKPHEKATALSVLGRSGVGRDAGQGKAVAALFAAELGNEYPLVREFAAEALRETFGDACDLDLAKDRATVDAAMQRCSRAAGVVVGQAAPAVGLGNANEEPVED